MCVYVCVCECVCACNMTLVSSNMTLVSSSVIVNKRSFTRIFAAVARSGHTRDLGIFESGWLSSCLAIDKSRPKFRGYAKLPTIFEGGLRFVKELIFL